jgi:hypothetical protein
MAELLKIGLFQYSLFDGGCFVHFIVMLYAYLLLERRSQFGWRQGRFVNPKCIVDVDQLSQPNFTLSRQVAVCAAYFDFKLWPVTTALFSGSAPRK